MIAQAWNSWYAGLMEKKFLRHPAQDQHGEERREARTTDEYRKQLSRIEELEALLKKGQTERIAEVQKLRDEIMRLTGLLDEMRNMQSQSQFEVQKFRDEIMRLTRLLDEMRNIQSQPPARAEPVAPVQHTRISSFVRPGPSNLLETAMADASSGFRLIPPSTFRN